MPTKTLSIADLLRAGFESFKANLNSVVALFVAVQAIVFLLTYILNMPFLNILMIPVALFMQIAIFKSFKNPYTKFDYNEILSLKDADLKPTLWKLFVTYIIYAVLLTILFILLIIPGIIFMVYWYVFVYVLLDQGLTNMAALKKSKELISGHWWKTFALVVITVIVTGIASSIVNGITGSDPLVSGFLMAIVSGALSIYFGYVVVAYYFNLKK